MRWIETLPPPSTAPLIGDHFLHPDDITLLYGAGGTGKGFVASWLCRQLASEGIRTAILDFEQHQNEWRTRLMGAPMEHIAYEAFAEDISASHHYIKQCVSDLQLGALIIDSASRALPEPLKGQTDSAMVRKMFAVMHDFAVPCLVIAHVPKAGMKEGEPQRHVPNPIGSVQWTNQCRLSYSAIRHDAPGQTLVVELKAQKANDRPKPRVCTWEFHFDGDIVLDTLVMRQGQQWILSREMYRLLDRDGAVMTAAQIAVTLLADFPNHADKISRASVQRLLYRRAGGNHPLFRKVATGWVSVRGAGLWDVET